MYGDNMQEGSRRGDSNTRLTLILYTNTREQQHTFTSLGTKIRGSTFFTNDSLMDNNFAMTLDSFPTAGVFVAPSSGLMQHTRLITSSMYGERS